MQAEKKITKPIPIRLTEDHIKKLTKLQEDIGVSTNADVIRWLINSASVKSATVKFALPKTAQN